VLTARAQLGSSLKEIDDLDSFGSANALNYKSALSDIQDLDYVKALTSLSQQQTTLQAAQQSFVKTAGLSCLTILIKYFLLSTLQRCDSVRDADSHLFHFFGIQSDDMRLQYAALIVPFPHNARITVFIQIDHFEKLPDHRFN
jgi:hypothetical protein